MSLKRKSSETDAAAPKKAKTGYLTDWVSAPAHLKVPTLIVNSIEVQDRDSTFIAHAAPITQAAQSDIFRRHVRESHADDPASHEMVAYRTMIEKAGKSGAESVDNWTLKTGQDDDGEKYGANKILKTIEEEGAIDVAVVVSRWFGGTLIGPARFRHIEDVTRDALKKLKLAEEKQELVQQLMAYDVDIEGLCTMLGQSSSPGKVPDYESMNVTTAQRLLIARQKRIEVLKKNLAAKSPSLPAAAPQPPVP